MPSLLPDIPCLASPSRPPPISDLIPSSRRLRILVPGAAIHAPPDQLPQPPSTESGGERRGRGAGKMISRQLVLTYLYLLIYVCLSSGVILFNKVRLCFLPMRVYARLCAFRWRCGRVVAKQGRVRCIICWRSNRGKSVCLADAFVNCCPFCPQIQLICRVLVSV